MKVHPLAGKPALQESLLDVDALLHEYYARKPDIGDPAQRVAFGTSGHRGSALRGTFNEAHVLAMTQAICQYRTSQGTSGPPFLGKDTHALSSPAFATASIRSRSGQLRRRRSASRGDRSAIGRGCAARFAATLGSRDS